MGGVKFHPQIIIGNNVSIESDCHIGAIDSVIIEDNVLIASFVFISDHLHGESKIEDLQICPSKRSLYSKGGIRICRNVWLGEKSIILSGVTIGEGSIIGAGAVVTHDIPPYCIAGGNPARVIKDLK